MIISITSFPLFSEFIDSISWLYLFPLHINTDESVHRIFHRLTSNMFLMLIVVMVAEKYE
jgi:hypothetical protein